MKNKLITHKVYAGVYDIDVCPPDSSVYTCFRLVAESGNKWSLTNSTFYEEFKSKKEAVDFLGTITRAEYDDLFQE